jgi:hypothetical protein
MGVVALLADSEPRSLEHATFALVLSGIYCSLREIDSRSIRWFVWDSQPGSIPEEPDPGPEDSGIAPSDKAQRFDWPVSSNDR